MLINKGADINAKNILGITPLFISCKYKKINIIKKLLEHGAIFNILDYDVMFNDSSLSIFDKKDYSEIKDIMTQYLKIKRRRIM
jgi:ankyrin repeat protein